VLPRGGVLWLPALGAAATAVAFAAARIAAPWKRAAPALAVLAVTVAVLWGVGRVQGGADCSEARRASLPPGVVQALRGLDAPLRFELFLDRDDGRRAQVERDALSKLLLARPDLVVDTPLDGREAPREGVRDDGYGRIVVHVGTATRETRSTSRRELTTLVFETAGLTLPPWDQPVYPGYPVVIDGAARTAAASLSYLLLPAGVLLLGWRATRIRRRKP